MISQTFQTTHGEVTLTSRHYNSLVNSFVVELKLTPPALWGWGITATFPDELEDKLTPDFIEVWASEAIGKLV
ncbi:hypothetical protein [Photobacterium sanguinicancri]|uniref:hypothetical protein n=1 Tax=Photobacterium sanguinicancri TaxID=875932 RepID=UPI0024818F88|nr:hypothetical protein [Photobacterium sanguinicancri]